MVYSMIDVPLLVLMLLMFKSCGIIIISKIDFFKFSGTESVNVSVMSI